MINIVSMCQYFAATSLVLLTTIIIPVFLGRYLPWVYFTRRSNVQASFWRTIDWTGTFSTTLSSRHSILPYFASLVFFLKHAGELHIIVLIGIKFLDTRRIHGLDQSFYTCVPETKEDYHTRPTQMQQGTQPPCSCHGPKAQLLSDFLQHHLSPWLGVVKHAAVPGLPNGSLVFII